VKPLKRYGAWRAGGSLILDSQGARISGLHVFPIAQRLMIVAGVEAAALILSKGRLLIGIIPLYLLVEYLWLKRDIVEVPWGSVRELAVDPRRELVALEFADDRTISPVVLRTAEWEAAHRFASEHAFGPWLRARPGGTPVGRFELPPPPPARGAPAA
jgi:hypothetical protein